MQTANNMIRQNYISSFLPPYKHCVHVSLPNVRFVPENAFDSILFAQGICLINFPLGGVIGIPSVD